MKEFDISCQAPCYFLNMFKNDLWKILKTPPVRFMQHRYTTYTDQNRMNNIHIWFFVHIHCILYCITHIFIYIYFFTYSFISLLYVLVMCMACVGFVCMICVGYVYGVCVCVCEPTYHSICVEVWVPLCRVTSVFPAWWQRVSVLLDLSYCLFWAGWQRNLWNWLPRSSSHQWWDAGIRIAYHSTLLSQKLFNTYFLTCIGKLF